MMISFLEAMLREKGNPVAHNTFMAGTPENPSLFPAALVRWHWNAMDDTGTLLGHTHFPPGLTSIYLMSPTDITQLRKPLWYRALFFAMGEI